MEQLLGTTDNFGNEKKFYAGIILFNPENELFVRSIEILLSCEIKVIVFDNSTKLECLNYNRQILFDRFGDNVFVLKSAKGNVGLGYPFNQIVKIAIKEGNCKGIYFFDQDSEVNLEAVVNLEKSFNLLYLKEPFGIIAATAMRQNGMPYRIRKRHGVSNYSNLLKVHQVPSSFSLIPITTFEKVGFFHEDFFIDHIDMDFSMRCWENNLAIYVDKNAKFIHEVGVGDVIFFKKRLFPISDTYRHYYQIRNLILSLKRNNKKNWFFFKEILIRIVVVFIISIYVGNFFERFRYLIKGIRDGFKGVSGKLT